MHSEKAQSVGVGQWRGRQPAILVQEIKRWPQQALALHVLLTLDLAAALPLPREEGTERTAVRKLFKLTGILGRD